MSDLYDGPARLRLDEVDHAVRVRLYGHFDPIDGRYHWRGMVFDLPAETTHRMPRSVSLSIGDHAAVAQLTEVTPWGNPTVSGVGAPPYPLAEVGA